MVQLTRIYTRGGDKGKSALGNGERLSKSHPRFEAIGAVDEANAALGWALQYAKEPEKDLLLLIQNDLFDVGADICMPDLRQEALRITEDQVVFLEKKIDAFNAPLAPLTSFVLPGGTKAAAALHLARTSVRRAERVLVALHEKEPLNPEVLRYVNRLSDLLFVMSRYLNNQGKDDILWVPGANRDRGK